MSAPFVGDWTIADGCYSESDGKERRRRGRPLNRSRAAEPCIKVSLGENGLSLLKITDFAFY
jgi:hypothetical protein